MKKHNYHDSGYKKLFSSPELVRQLLTSFVHEDWVSRIDYSTLQRIDKSFITDQFADRESDLIYKADFKGKDLYIFIISRLAVIIKLLKMNSAGNFWKV